MKEGTSQNLSSFYFHHYWIYVEIMTQNVNFLIIVRARILNIMVYQKHNTAEKRMQN